MTSGFITSESGFFRFLLLILDIALLERRCSGDLEAGSSVVIGGGVGSDESGESEVTSMRSIDGEGCRGDKGGSLGAGDSSGADGGGSTKSKMRVAI